jgi:hypothetical protein
MKLKTNLLPIAALLFSSLASSEQVALSLDISGKGIVSIKGTELSCNESCELMIEENTPLILEYLADADNVFGQWGEASCDSGEGVIISTSLNNVSKTSTPPKGIVMADFDGDTIDDVAMITLFSSSLEIQLNDGVGNFKSNQFIESLEYASALASIDWDNDSDIDLVVVDYASSKVKLYLNDGSGNFTFDSTLNIPGVSTYSIAIADVDSDNLPDILIGSFTANIDAPSLEGVIDSISNTDLSWYKNNGDSTFSHLETVATDQGIFTLDIDDVDNDGDLDIAAAATTSNQTLLYTNNQGSYDESVIDSGHASYGVAFGDIDKNGLSDIASVSYYDKTLQLSLQAEDGVFLTAESLYKFKTGSTAVAFSDVDNDGRIDITSGVFGDRAFYWHRNLSYQACAITLSGKRTVTASFIAAATTPAPSTPVAPVSESSSGGSVNFYVFFVLLTVSLRRKLLGS